MPTEKLIDIEKVDSIDESNYLDVDFRNFVQKQGNQEFQNALDILWATRKAIKRAIDLGLTDRINPPLHQYYLEAVRWLKGQANTVNWIGIGAFGQSGDKNSEMSQFVNSWHPNYLSQFFSSSLLVPLYVQDQKAREFTPTKNALRLISEEAEKTKKALENVAAQNNQAIDGKANEASQSIQSKVDEVANFIDSKKNEIEQQIAMSNLTTWAKFYKERVKEYESLVNGLRADTQKKGAPWYQKLLAIKCSPILQWSKSLKARRFMWFSLLTLVLIMFVLIASGIIHLDISSELKKELNNPLLFKLGITAPLLLIPSVGYAFANKNYRIYANLLEQYKHREVVAETLNGIIASFGSDPAHAEVRQNLTLVGAQAIFEHKTVGHLTKRDGDSTPIAELIQLFGKH